MIVFGAEAKRLERARREPFLPITSIDVRALLEATRARYFPEVPPTPVFFITQGPLACIVNADSAHPVVFIHQILNDPECPAHVFDLICKHELIHTRVRPARTGDRELMHPPEFWELERQIAPGAAEAWDWLNMRLGSLLVRRADREGVYVHRGWRAHLAREARAWRELQHHFRQRSAEAGGATVTAQGLVGARPELFPFRLE